MKEPKNLNKITKAFPKRSSQRISLYLIDHRKFGSTVTLSKCAIALSCLLVAIGFNNLSTARAMELTVKLGSKAQTGKSRDRYSQHLAKHLYQNIDLEYQDSNSKYHPFRGNDPSVFLELPQEQQLSRMAEFELAAGTDGCNSFLCALFQREDGDVDRQKQVVINLVNDQELKEVFASIQKTSNKDQVEFFLRLTNQQKQVVAPTTHGRLFYSAYSEGGRKTDFLTDQRLTSEKRCEFLKCLKANDGNNGWYRELLQKLSQEEAQRFLGQEYLSDYNEYTRERN